jgi:hypothetical protein
MICKDLGISELLFELLYFMRRNLDGRYKRDPEDEDEEGPAGKAAAG